MFAIVSAFEPPYAQPLHAPRDPLWRKPSQLSESVRPPGDAARRRVPGIRLQHDWPYRSFLASMHVVMRAHAGR